MMFLILFTLSLLCFVVSGDKDYCSSQGSPSKNSSDMKSNHEHIKFYTTRPGHNEKSETMAVSYDGGLYVAGEKVVTETEHRRVVSELRDELHSTQTSLQETQAEVVALVQALRKVSPANGSSIVRPPTCEEPGGDKLHYNGTHWECVCKDGYSGKSCQILPCEREWVQWKDSCYRLFQTKTTWGLARQNCLSYGGDLVSIHNKEEDDFVLSLKVNFWADSWYGGTDVQSEGVWTWSDGSPWDYSIIGWNPSNSRGNEHCLEHSLDGWNDDNCDKSANYVCKYNLVE